MWEQSKGYLRTAKLLYELLKISIQENLEHQDQQK